MRFLSLALIVFLIFKVNVSQAAKPFGELKEERKYQNYTVRIYHNDEDLPDADKNPRHQYGFGCFEMLESGKQVYFESGVFFAVELVGARFDANLPESSIARRINRDDQPYLIISSSTGRHSDNSYYIFEIGLKFKFLQKIETTIGGEFKDLRSNGELEFVMQDWVFEYWHCAGTQSPQPTLILRYQGHEFKPDLELMKKPGPNELNLEREAGVFKAKFPGVEADMFYGSKWSAPYEMWSRMLDLIYAGNEDAAWRLCDLSWPADHLGKARFVKEFKKQLATSRYYEAIRYLNHKNLSIPRQRTAMQQFASKTSISDRTLNWRELSKQNLKTLEQI